MKIKNKLAIILIFILSMSVTVPVFASNEGVINILSEYDIIKNLQSLSDEELLQSGYTKEQLSQLRSIDFYDMVRNEQQKSRADLLRNGYNEQDILDIMSEDVEIAARAMTGTLYYGIGFDSLTYNSGNDETVAKTIFSWKWIEPPFWTFTDIIGMAISNEMYLDRERSSIAITYYEDNKWSGSYRTINAKPTPVSTTSFAKHVFDINLFTPSNNKVEVALRGTAVLVWTKHGKLTEASTTGNYGHTVLDFTPSLTASSSGIDFSFTPDISVEDTDPSYDYISTK